jgi:hypothetical protein
VRAAPGGVRGRSVSPDVGRTSRTVSRLGPALVAAILVAGCGLLPPATSLRSPEIVGVIVSRDRVATRIDRYVLSGGRQLDLDYNLAHDIDGSDLDVGDLLLLGHDKDGEWYLSLGGGADCYALLTKSTRTSSSSSLPSS